MEHSGSVDVPLRVPLIAGETTASYLARTAAANALTHSEVLRALQPGRRTRTSALRTAATEVYVSPASLRLLDVPGCAADGGGTPYWTPVSRTSST
ncbi:hypothetical protein ACWEWI_35805 [Streptomyces sp. NPDC003753]|uniref:hypothetical protein n=1 Tax=Streptomyces sp. Y2F8-2 TaxID=2759675 RepID=UPI0019064CEC|nr:hypothetical protein [Streptomyces sp. Y2F8-2]GHK01775.1 hypothetical protein SY2F82_35720 [Streptomyces sp. Y2F8-2]